MAKKQKVGGGEKAGEILRAQLGGLAARLTFASSQTEVVDALLALRGADVRVSFARVGDAGEHEAEDAE